MYWLIFRLDLLLNICPTIMTGYLSTVIFTSGLEIFSLKIMDMVSALFTILKDISHITMGMQTKDSGSTI